MSTGKKYIPHYDVEDYQQWEGDWELWEGVPVSMSPSPFARHSKLLGQIVTKLNVAIDATHCDANVLVELDWIISNDTILRPDCVVACGSVPEKHLTTPPAIVVEVLSKSTRQRDLDHKRAIYQQEKVPYYLILDPDAEQLTVLKLDADGKYKQADQATNATGADGADTLALKICGDCELSVDVSTLFK